MKQANSKHLDEAMHNTASHQGIHCLFERDTNKCQIIEKINLISNFIGQSITH